MRGWLLGIAMALPGAALAEHCTTEEFDGAPFTWCVVDLARDDLRLWRADEAGAPFGSFDRLDRSLADEKMALGIAMNAGMYHPDRSAVGLYVEEGREEAPIVTREGPGNFGLLPNGVFCLKDATAMVIESRAFDAARPECRFATQSGPMLVIDGALHPRFLPGSDSVNIRNGVGTRNGGREVVLAISDAAVNFHHFARLFRDQLGVKDALFFDGRVSKLYAPGLGRKDVGSPMGPIIGTVEPRS